MMSWSSRKKKRAFFVPIILFEGNFVNICALSQCVNYTFRVYILLRIKKYYFLHFCCLFLKSSEAFSASLNRLVIFTSLKLWRLRHAILYSSSIRSSQEMRMMKLVRAHTRAQQIRMDPMCGAQQIVFLKINRCHFLNPIT